MEQRFRPRFPFSLVLLTGFVAVILVACGDGSDTERSAGTDTSSTPPTSVAFPTALATTSAPGPTETSSPTTVLPPEAETPTTTQMTPVGFSTDVLPIIEYSCARCHTGGGPGTVHLRLDTVGDAVENSDLIFAAVSRNIMPPWPATELSVAFQNNWGLSEEEREILVAWARAPLTDDVHPDTAIVASGGTRTLGDVDIAVAGANAYDGDQGQPDEYRCFIYDPGFVEETWLRGYEFAPDQTEVVHHAIGYRVSASSRERASAVDAESPDQGGWPCFGSSGVGESEIFLGWAPGQGPTELPSGSGLRMGAGDFIVLQIHYHYEVEAPADNSLLLLDVADADEGPLDEVRVVQFLAPAEIPCAEGEVGPLCDREAAIQNAIGKYGTEGVQANIALLICRAKVADFAEMTSGVASSSCDLPARADGTIVSVLGHEHELGSSFRMTLNPGSPDERILLDIPDWDFDWQLNYYPVEEITVSARDTIRIECSWDRSRRDPDLEPAYVVWADGTDDEMCFATMVVRSTS